MKRPFLERPSRRPAPSRTACHWLILLAIVWVPLGCGVKSKAPPEAPLATNAPVARPPKAFSFQEHYRSAPGQPNRLKTHFQGVDPKFIKDDIFVKELRLISLEPDGRTNWIIEAADCLYERNQKVARSTNRLQVTAGGGAMSIQGEGFYWRQSDDLIAISNQTHALVHQKQSTIEVTSRGFEYNASERRVAFWDQVRSRDPEMEMTSQWLALRLRESAGGLTGRAGESGVESIVAETNVVAILAAQETETHSQRAEYREADGQETIELTGDPSWKRGPRQGRADRLYLDRKTKFFLAQGNTYAKLPGGEVLQAGDLFQSLSQRTNSVRAAQGTNDFVEIRADESRLWTNGAVFVGNVRGNEVGGEGEPVRLVCGTLDITNSAPTTSFDSIVMRENVLIQQGATNIQASRMDFSKVTRVALFSGKAAWTAGPLSGGADLLRLNLERREMDAQGQATLQRPIDETMPFAAQLVSTNPPTATRLPRTLRIQCDDYAVDGGQARFHRRVRATQFEGDTPSGSLASEWMLVKFAQPGNRIDRFLAETNVVVETLAPGSTNAFRRLHCERLTGEATAASQGKFTRLLAELEVLLEEETLTAKGPQRRTARGDTLTYDLLSEKGRLDGHARVEAPDLVMSSSALLMDMKTGKITTPPGAWEAEYRLMKR